MRDFKTDIAYGNKGIEIFKTDFLEFLNINYTDVTNCQQFQVIDTDFLTKIGLYEIKLNYKDDEYLIIEEYTNINSELCPISKGWFYKTKADLIISISKNTRTMVFLPFTEKFKEYYELNKNNYSLFKNRLTIKDDKKWQSAFRKLPFSFFNGYISIYKKTV